MLRVTIEQVPDGDEEELCVRTVTPCSPVPTSVLFRWIHCKLLRMFTSSFFTGSSFFHSFIRAEMNWPICGHACSISIGTCARIVSLMHAQRGVVRQHDAKRLNYVVTGCTRYEICGLLCFSKKSVLHRERSRFRKILSFHSCQQSSR